MSCIPERIKIVARDRDYIYYEGSHASDIPGYEPENKRVAVYKAYVVNAKRKIDSAKKWAYGSCAEALEDDALPIIERDNTPISSLRIVDLDVRGGGGRAYKVIDEKGFCYDLREDTLLDAIKGEGIGPGGVLNGQFVWASVSSQTKLIYVGSDIYKKLSKEAKINRLPFLKKKDLVVGGVYKSKNGSLRLYLGSVDCTVSKGCGRSFCEHYDIRELQNCGLWVLGWHYYPEDQQLTQIKEKLANPDPYRYDFIKAVNVLEKVDQLQVPDNVIEECRSKANTNFVNALAEASLPRIGYSTRRWWRTEDVYNSFLGICSMRKHGEPLPDISAFASFMQANQAAA